MIRSRSSLGFRISKAWSTSEKSPKYCGPVRLANFSRRATGTTKGIRTGDARYILLADALLRFLPGLADRVEAESPRDPSERRRLALECLGIFRNETPVDVLCFGSFVLDKRGALIDAPVAHRTLGEPVRLMLLHLRDAHATQVRASRIVSIENETTFNDYVDQLTEEGGEEIVLCSQGQANWAVVRLLRMLHEAEPTVPVFHWGDLDRFGVLILRSLRRRSGVPVQPLHMDPETLRRFSAEGLPLPPGEREEIDSLLKKRWTTSATTSSSPSGTPADGWSRRRSRTRSLARNLPES